MRLVLVCHGATAATRKAAFPVDEPLEASAVEQARTLGAALPDSNYSWTSPALRARQTALALSLDANPQPALAECDYGRWAGRRLKDVSAEEPEAVETWLRDFEAAPHGGESLAVLFARVSGWLDKIMIGEGQVIAVTHASVIRAAVIHLLRAPRESFWQIDIEPLSVVDLTGVGQSRRLRVVPRGLFA